MNHKEIVNPTLGKRRIPSMLWFRTMLTTLIPEHEGVSRKLWSGRLESVASYSSFNITRIWFE